MTLRYSSGEGQAWQEGRAKELDTLSERLCDLVERDAGVYDKVARAKELPAGDERDRALDKAYRGALETPIEIMEACLGGLRIAAAGAPQGVPDYLSVDCLAGAQALEAGLGCALLMVRENSTFVDDDAFTGEILAAADVMSQEALALVAAVRADVEGRRA